MRLQSSRGARGFAVHLAGGLLALSSSACTRPVNRVDLALRDPHQVRVELRQWVPFRPGPSAVSLEEGVTGRGHSAVYLTGRLSSPYHLESHASRASDGSITQYAQQLPAVGAEPDLRYTKRRLLWARAGSELRFSNDDRTDYPAVWVDRQSLKNIGDRGASRLIIESHAVLIPGTSGWTVDNEYVWLPSVVVSTPMHNVRSLRAVTFERRSLGWWMLLPTVVGAALSATLVGLSFRDRDSPQPFLFGLGSGAGAIAVTSAVFAGWWFVRGDRDTVRDLMAPRLHP